VLRNPNQRETNLEGPSIAERAATIFMEAISLSGLRTSPKLSGAMGHPRKSRTPIEASSEILGSNSIKTRTQNKSLRKSKRIETNR
jgi:hypothetical protein